MFIHIRHVSAVSAVPGSSKVECTTQRASSARVSCIRVAGIVYLRDYILTCLVMFIYMSVCFVCFAQRASSERVSNCLKSSSSSGSMPEKKNQRCQGLYLDNRI